MSKNFTKKIYITNKIKPEALGALTGVTKNIISNVMEPIGKRVTFHKDGNATVIVVDGKEVMRNLSIKNPEVFCKTLETVLGSGLTSYELTMLTDIVETVT